MDTTMFFTSLLVTVGVVVTALVYLRDITRRVVRELCSSDAGAEFWLRSADILAYSGSLMLVLLFGKFGAADWVEVLRVTLILTLAGLFITVLFVANGIWRNVERQASPGRAEADGGSS